MNIWRLTPELTGVAEQRVVGTAIDPDDDGTVVIGDLFGGIGLSYDEGRWYVTGTRGCGDCGATQFSYIMSADSDPMGTWMSPDDFSTVEPLHPGHLSSWSANSQPVGACMIPDGQGGTQVVITSSRYRSSPTGAPGTKQSQSGDNNSALAGLFLTPLEYAEDGRIEPVAFDAPTHSIPLDEAAAAPVPDPYQAALSVTSTSSLTPTWSIDAVRTTPTLTLDPHVRRIDPTLRSLQVLEGGKARAPRVDRLAVRETPVPCVRSIQGSIDYEASHSAIPERRSCTHCRRPGSPCCL